MATLDTRASADPGIDANAARQAFRLLHIGFVAAPILAGLDKFLNLLTDWTIYLAPLVPELLGIPAQVFMYAVGVVEIVAGILVALRPRIGGYIVAAWLVGIILNLLVLGEYFDIALRDLGLALGALALARLAPAVGASAAGGVRRTT